MCRRRFCGIGFLFVIGVTAEDDRDIKYVCDVNDSSFTIFNEGRF